jgi:hypothetical protein
MDKRLEVVERQMEEPASSHEEEFEARLCATWAVLRLQAERPRSRSGKALTHFVQGLGTLGLRLFGDANVPLRLWQIYRACWLEQGGPDLSDSTEPMASFFRDGGRPSS